MMSFFERGNVSPWIMSCSYQPSTAKKFLRFSDFPFGSTAIDQIVEPHVIHGKNYHKLKSDITTVDDLMCQPLFFGQSDRSIKKIDQ